MTGTNDKKNIALGFLTYLETRALIIAVGAICFAVFPQKNQQQQQLSIHEILNIKSVWHRFDSYWYLKLATEGYPQQQFTDKIQQTWGFMPLYPLCIKALSWIFAGNLFFTGIFISTICTLAALYIIYKLCEQKFGTGLEAVTLILTCAGTFYLSIVYTEGLFILLTAAVFYLSNQGKYGWALVVAGLASVTRIQGCLLFVIPAIEILTLDWKTSYKYLPALLLSLMPMLTLMLYLNATCGEPLAFLKIQHAWGSADTYPLQGFIKLPNGDRPNSSIVNSFFWIVIVGIVLSCYRKLPFSYILYTVLYFLLSTSNEIVYGTTRYMLGVLPLFFAVTQSNPLVKQFFILLNLLFLAVTIATFVTNTATFI